MSDLGSLSTCMIDSDQEAIVRARRLRRKALVVSVFLEAVCLAAMLLWPLITPGVLPGIYVVTPVPPYHGGGASRPAQPHPVSNRAPRPVPAMNQIAFPTPNARNRAPEHPPTLDAEMDLDGASGPGGPDIPGGGGPLIPGAANDGVRVAPPHPAEPVRQVRQKVSEGVMEGALLHRIEPQYPEIARAMRLSGVVQLRAIIATNGTVEKLEVLNGNPILARAALAAVSQWRYRPTLLSGVPVEVETYVTVNFVLGQ